MKALVYHGSGKKSWHDVPDPKLLDLTDAVIQVDTTTICGTDLHILKEDVPARREHLERVRGRAGPHPRYSVAGQIGPDGLTVSSQVRGDRGDRPTLATQCMHVDIVLPCEHERHRPP